MPAGATVTMPNQGGPIRWELTVTDPVKDHTIFQETFGWGGPRIIRITEHGARLAVQPG